VVALDDALCAGTHGFHGMNVRYRELHDSLNDALCAGTHGFHGENRRCH